MGLTRAALARPIFIFMLMLGAFFLGFISYRSMRLELNPEVNFGAVTVTTVYPGAGPDEINQLISRPIEEAVSGVNGLREVTSTSREGISTVVLSLELGVDTDVALNDVRTKVDQVTNRLPKDALKPTVGKFDNSAQPILYLSFTSPTMNSRDLRDLLDKKLTDRFSEIQGVASATVTGGDVREIQVQVKKDKLLAYGIGINDVQRALAANNLNAPAGKLDAGTREFSVRVKNQFENIDQIRNMIFTVSDPKSFGGKPKSVRLSDVANVVDTVQERTTYARMNGKDNIVLGIQKTREGNAVEITQKADEIVSAIEKEYAPQGIKVTKTLETAKQITQSLDDLNLALMFGIALVAIIVYVFLHNFRGTLIVALAIPTSIFATFIALKMMGFTINNMSMLALSLAIGVLVDDAIVVIENIYRHLRMGEDPRDAAINGRSEIGLAAIAITLADVVVFLPIAFMGGIVGQFFKPLALGFVAATLFSLFVSFTLTPMLASRWYRRGEDLEHPTGAFAVWFERQFTALQNFYRRVLEWSLNHRWFVFIIGNSALFAVITFIAGGFAPTPAAALQSLARMFFMVAVLLGFVAFAVMYWKNAFPGRLKLTMGLPITVAAFVLLLVAVPPSIPIPPALKLVLAFILPWPILNIFRRGARSRLLLNGILVGSIFLIAAVVGYSFGHWKQEAVFKFGFLPSSDSGQVSVTIELPPGSSLSQTEQIVELVEQKMQGNPDVKYIVSQVGSQTGGFGGGGNTGSNYAQVQATLYDKKALLDYIKGSKEHLRTRTANSVAADMLQKIGRVPGANVNVSAGDAFGFGSPIQMSFTSDNSQHLVQTTSAVLQKLRQGAVKGIINPDISSKPGKPEIQVRPDPAMLADAGTDVSSLGAAMRTLYQGNNDSKMRVNGYEYDIRVMMDLKDRNDPNLINEVPIAFKQGNPIYVGSIGKLVQEPALDKVERRNRMQEIRVTADLLPGFAAGSVQAEIDNLIKKENLIPGDVRYKPLGQADAQAREMGFMIGAFLIGLLLVYMLLASLFNNILYPFIIQLAQPQAMVGALLALVLTDKSFNLVGFIGLVTLTGLVGKNAILVVDYANTLRERGRNRHDALVEAGPIRLRPIMMTTLALILGMLPVALAIGRGSEFRETIGITVIGGISLSTLLTLLVIPCSYTIFDDLSNWIRGIMRRGSPPASQVPYAEGPPETDIEHEPVNV